MLKLWRMCVSVTVNSPELAALPRIELARPHIDVLCLNLELPASFSLGPLTRTLKQTCSDPLPPIVRMYADVPQRSQVRSTFQHVHLRRAKSDSNSPDRLIAIKGQKEAPFGNVEAFCPLSGFFSLVLIVVFDVWFIEFFFSEF